MGSVGKDIKMSFLWIALSLSLTGPVLSSINPILRHIDNNNPDGPHFRSFLFPNSRALATPHLAAVPTIETQKSPEVVSSRKINLQVFPSLSVVSTEEARISPGLPSSGHARSSSHDLENQEVLENLQITRNSLETFVV